MPARPILIPVVLLTACGLGLESESSFTDADKDGYPDFVDCDDDNADVHPMAEEICNEIDDNCDGVIDEAGVIDGIAVWPDLDQDGYGDSRFPTTMCEVVVGWVSNGDDCDDLKDDVSPDQVEICDGYDNDCNGLTDTEDTDLYGEVTTYYADKDGDGYGDPFDTKDTCTQPLGYTDNDEDCNDDSKLAAPGLTEVCSDGLDNDCDGSANDCGLSGTYDLDFAKSVLFGTDSSDYAGSALATTGDVNGDGIGDALIGAYQAGGDNSSTSGVAYVVLGPLDGEINVASEVELQGRNSGDYAGWSVGANGDIDGDGYLDVAVGAPYDDTTTTNAGAAYVTLGPVRDLTLNTGAEGAIVGDASGDYAGWSVSIAGDMDGDGNDDLWFGAKGDDGSATDSGTAYLFLGPATGDFSASQADATLYGENASDNAGTTVVHAGDVDGDGMDDVLVGAPGNSSGGSAAGMVYLVEGPIAGTIGLGAASARFVGYESNMQAGFTISAGDHNGDGKSDVVIGSPYASSYTGQAYVFNGDLSGTLSLSAADAVISGAAAGDYAGYSVSMAGDADGDGKADLLVGAIYADGAVADSGAAYLVPGPISGTQGLDAAQAIFNGLNNGDQTGYSVAITPDVDGDGADDILIGAPYSDMHFSNGGVVFVEYGGGI